MVTGHFARGRLAKKGKNTPVLKSGCEADRHWLFLVVFCRARSAVEFDSNDSLDYPPFVTLRGDWAWSSVEALSRQRLKDFQEIETSGTGFFLEIFSLALHPPLLSSSHDFFLAVEPGE